MGSSGLVRLTEHERDILGLYARGVRGRRLADEKQITYNTVRSHYERICQKLGERDMLSAAIRLVEERNRA
jgi:DNA-binding NarL/FixJ family response regulator